MATQRLLRSIAPPSTGPAAAVETLADNDAKQRESAAIAAAKQLAAERADSLTSMTTALAEAEARVSAESAATAEGEEKVEHMQRELDRFEALWRLVISASKQRE